MNEAWPQLTQHQKSPNFNYTTNLHIDPLHSDEDRVDGGAAIHISHNIEENSLGVDEVASV